MASRASASSAQGVQQFLDELRQSVRERTYTPLPVREHAIPKRGSGKVRKLGIPALADRIVQMALVLVPFDSASEASALALRASRLSEEPSRLKTQARQPARLRVLRRHL